MRNNIKRVTITTDAATGTNGSATASGVSTTPIDGVIMAVYVEYLDSPPNTTDVEIVEAYNSPAMSILTLSNANTDGWFYPYAATVDQTGQANAASDEPIPVSDNVAVNVTGANAGDSVSVTVVWESRR